MAQVENNHTKSKKTYSKRQVQYAIARVRRNSKPLHSSAESALKLVEHHLKIRSIEEHYK